MINSGVTAKQWASSGVAILTGKDWKHKIQDYIWVSDRIIETRIRVLNRNFTIVGVFWVGGGRGRNSIWDGRRKRTVYWAVEGKEQYMGR
jgi:hypothetical protein